MKEVWVITGDIENYPMAVYATEQSALNALSTWYNSSNLKVKKFVEEVPKTTSSKVLPQAVQDYARKYPKVIL